MSKKKFMAFELYINFSKILIKKELPVAALLWFLQQLKALELRALTGGCRTLFIPLRATLAINHSAESSLRGVAKAPGYAQS